MGSGKCPSGTVYDDRNDGECWRCDSGFGRTLSAVNEWDACGRFGAQARSATFVRRACPQEGSFRDPRNGGECWTCPEDYNRTLNPVTGAQACKIDRNFAPAINRGDFACGNEGFFDFVDGGTCWKCPNGGKRTWDSVKSATACRLDRMQWVMPNRQTYGIFGLGEAADDILAKMIADRTKIDEAITKLALKTNKPVATVSQNVWSVINKSPEKSPVLSALLQVAVIELAKKPVAQQTASEKALLARVAQLIQWNRQFIAYQARQAHDTWVKASQAYYEVALSKMGAAAVYADSMVTPPDYNEILAGSIQVGAGVAGPVAAALVTTFWENAQIFIRPFAEAAREAGKEVAKDVALGAVEGTSGATGSATAAASGPLLIAIAAAVIVTMEVDKFMALEKADGQIANSIRIADRPVDLSSLLQSADGPDEFLFHWAAVLGAETRPSANFNARLAAYKAGTNPDVVRTTPTAPIHGTSSAGMTMGVTSVQLSGGLPGINTSPAPTPAPTTAPTSTTTAHVAPPAPLSLPEQIEIAVKKQKPRAQKGAMRLEISSRPGNCMTKNAGTSQTMTTTNCNDKRAMWITPDAKGRTLVFDREFCLDADLQKLKSPQNEGKRGDNNRSVQQNQLMISACSANDPGQKWQLTQQGNIQQLNTELCLALQQDGGIILQKCGTNPAQEIWRPWAGR
ncbi:hypothetical protein JCM17960_02940 [Magnetospira thiophila]